MKDHNFAATKNTQIRVTKRSPEYWRVTFDHSPLNIFGPEMLPQMAPDTALSAASHDSSATDPSDARHILKDFSFPVVQCPRSTTAARDLG